MPKENHIKITENKVLTDSLENNKENNVPNFSSSYGEEEQNTDKIEKNSSNHHDNNNAGNGNENKDDIEEIIETDQKSLKKSTGPRALKRRHGKKFTKSGLQRRKSFNGHW